MTTKIINTTTVQGIEFHKINHDINGNPRYVFHFMDVHTDKATALLMAKRVGAKKYTGKAFAGCFVMQSYSLDSYAEAILKPLD